jgi:hypothetical protein
VTPHKGGRKTYLDQEIRAPILRAASMSGNGIAVLPPVASGNNCLMGAAKAEFAFCEKVL